MSASNAQTTSNLRPRTRRLISGLDEGDEVDFDPTTAPTRRIASPVPSLLDHRSASPIPPTHLPRPTSSYDRRLANTTDRGERGTGVRGLGPDSSTSLERLWGTSWTAIQGIASDLLGSSTHDGPPLAKGKVPRPRRSGEQLSKHRATVSAPPMTWGPRTPGEAPTINDVGTGTREEMEAALRARKMIDLLTAQDTSFIDSLGRYKRRTSDEAVAATTEADERNARDALVYLHHVQKGDTLAGITLRYSCTAEVVRRTNRMWPNDPVQSRTTILLPVDACGVKGRRVSGPEEVDLLGDENAPIPAGLAETSSSSLLTTNGDAQSRHRSNSNVTSTTAGRSSSVARSTTASEPAWQHDSWTLLPGTTKPTEIVRLLRQALGYFPPARRKSQTFSDMDSPKSSFDRPRSLVAEALNRPPGSPVRKSKSARPPSNRRMSNAGNGYFGSSMAGPGGVGTMDRTVRAPGPGQDSLNAYFAKHLPDVAPPRNQHALYQPDMPLFSDDITPTPSGTSTPSANKNLEHMGSAIESWMRRVASKAKEAATPAERHRAARASVGAPGKGAGGIGDLIEMTDEFEIGMDDEAEAAEDARGRSAIVGSGSSATATSHGVAPMRQRGIMKSGKAD
ncbi:hypothetical protein AMS68_006225 [Peltaster fructicola]|uniref:LysM domain-containing protein n=1 Tax=Peltaster fructicola TaxID=286661 RepID=A0A6H0Y1H8_9PEZI|nr:hypothetical protein AMS68_006225 [Peltaster fructicola]